MTVWLSFLARDRRPQYVIVFMLAIFAGFFYLSSNLGYYDHLKGTKSLRKHGNGLSDDAAVAPVSGTAVEHQHHNFTDVAPVDSDQAKGFLHLLVPATSSNADLCKMLLSITANGYPSPVLINWGDEEEEDEYVQHLAKVGGILRYLKNLLPSNEDDLVLIVDGYDAWFQLRPDVMISRYYNVIERQNRQLIKAFGAHAVEEHGLFQSVLFGPDKICWPEDQRRPAYWAVPDSPLPKNAFGPDTDTGQFREHNRPRWLNSGTIMGPIGDVVRLFEATADSIANTSTDIISDQYHMANLFGLQEVNRLHLMGNGSEVQRERQVWVPESFNGDGHFENITIDVPTLDPETTYEYHIAIDYESQLFQTSAYYWKYLDWVAYDESTHAGMEQQPGEEVALMDQPDSLERQLHFDLPQDILDSPPPFIGTAIETLHKPTKTGKDPSRDPRDTGLDRPSQLSWREVTLGTNIVTRNIFPIVHFTPPKNWRMTWWHDMWFFPYGESIIRNAPPVQQSPILNAHGRQWWSWLPGAVEATVEPQQGGGVDDKAVWHSWDDLCRAHEGVVFLNQREPKPPVPPP